MMIDRHSVGFDEGYKKGIDDGELEGYHYGYHEGSRIGAEIGFYKGFVCTLIALDKQKKTEILISDKAKDIAKRLMLMLHCPPEFASKTVGQEQQISDIRRNYKRLCSLLKFNGNIFNNTNGTDLSY